MSRTTTALKRLAVPVLAAVTMVAGVPALVGTAQADHVSGVTLTPEASTAPAGTCQQFTVTYTVSNAATPTATIDVNLTPSATNTVAFCNNTAGATGQSTPTQTNTVGNGNVLNGEFTDNDGTFTFGVVSTTEQTVDVTAFAELNATQNDVPNTGEPADSSVATFTAGGAAATTAVDAEPETGFAVSGQPYTFTATARNASGQALSGVQIFFDVIAGPDAPFINATPCNTTTGQNGQAVCTFTNQGGPGTDTIRVYVNRPASTSSADVAAETNAFDANDPFDDITATFQAPQPAGTTVTLQCTTNRTNAAGTNCELPTTQTTQELTATVRNAAGAPQQGVAVTFSLNTAGEAGTVNDTETLSQTQCLTDANGQCTITVTDTRPTNGETLTVTASIQTNTGAQSATSVTTYRDPVAADARNIALSPKAATATVGSVQAVTATVTDRFGNPVPGVEVTFTENGTGRFVTGSSTFVVARTNAQGQAVAELTTTAGETPGSTTVTAEITSPRTTGTNNDECEQLANATGGTANSAPGARAGNCTDTATVNFVAASPSPSPSTTAPQSPSPSPTTGTPTPSPSNTAGPVDCRTTPTVTLERATIIATGSSGVRVTAPANSVIDLFAYSRPSSTYRVVRSAEVGQDGVADFRITPPTNTRLYAQIRGCDTDETRFSVVLNVRTLLTLFVERNGTRLYTFSGRALPARNGGLIVSLYRVTNDGRQILAAQTRADASTGRYTIRRQFTGNGRFGFVVRTGQDLQNAPGSSNVRSLLVF